jgi:alkanesulfonate monooxygenase SsuD/methylene tetrahydromethanopterin reductase-like flavin-dependent oxidoreductase (luciferase family)
VKFGLMYEIQIREPHYEGIEHERYKQVMAQAELADQVGFDHFWTVEHHFLREFSHCPAPEVLYGAISQRTKQIRIGSFSHEGRFYRIPPRSVIPKPVQKPHPPLWVACSQPDSFRQAGEMGLGALCFSLGGYEQMAERAGIYREGIKHAKPVGKFVNDQIAALCMIHCAENDEAARQAAAPEAMWFIGKAESLYAPWQGRKIPESYKFAVGAVQQEGAFAMGTPETIIKVLKKYQEAGVNQVLCFMQMGNLAHGRIMDSIDLFGRQVIPYFK